ncbi:MAG: ATP-binding protein [bacterium]|nr:ATP-binding protein [bacterium]
MNTAEYRMFQKALVEEFSLVEFDRFLKSRLNLSRENLAIGDDKQDIVFKVAEKAIRDGWETKFLFHAQQIRPKNVVFKTLLNRSGSPEEAKRWPDWYAPPPTFFGSCFIGDGDLFIDRDEIRQRIETILSADEDGERITLIDGPPSTGKTYVVEYIEFVRDHRGGFKLGLVDFESWIPNQVTPEGVMNELVTQAESETGSFDEFAQDARQGIKISELFLDYLHEDEKSWIVIFDHLTKTNVAQGTKDFVRELILQNQERESTNVHIVVLGAPDYLNPTDPIQLPKGVQVTELEEYFTALYTGHGGELTADGLQFLVNRTKNELGGSLDRSIADVAKAVWSACEVVFS